MSNIKILPQNVVNKIAAGEVIERPASVLKELIENSIDAGAMHIEIQLEDGGRKLIKVSDNGIGMDRDDMGLAFISHSTSKLENDEDLFSIKTLGFRGEALPSIGSVSQARIISRPKGALAGAEIQIEGCNLHKVKEIGSPEGTQVDVRNLFFNTPVRRKFLKSTHTEMAHISEMVTRFALAYPNIHFNTIHNGKNVSNFPPAKDTKERIVNIFGNEMSKDLITINSKEPNASLYGYVLPPTHNRPNTKMQFIFLNGRYIRDNIILHAINAAYSNLLMTKRSPIVFLFLQVDSKEVDVNVHPTKIEVRFRNAGLIHDQVYTTIHTALTRTEFHPSLKATSPPIHTNTENLPKESKETISHEKQESVMKSMSDFFSRSSENKHTYHKNEHKQVYFPHSKDENYPERIKIPTPFLQIHNSYIIEEAADGLNIIDQHALHEIILYHEILEQIKSSKLVTQNMLIPELVELVPRDYLAIMSLKSELNTLGIEIEEFGKSTIAVRTHPQILKNLDFRELIQSLLEEIDSDEIKRNADSILRKIVKIMACKGAVKSGQRLTPQEIQALLEKKRDNTATGFCPHGRPTTLEFKISELEKQFKRK
ncbi:MAG: DNA mismatch repair endonuclease MutL [Candidatus Scalinduaceae bacterium]